MTSTTSTTTRRPSRASRAAAANVVSLATGKSVTGTNKPATPKPATPKPAAKVTSKPAAKVTSKPASPAPLTDTARKRITAAALVRTAGDMIANWPATATGVSKEEARGYVAAWLNYIPCPRDAWDARLSAAPSGAGRTTKVTSKPATKVVPKPATPKPATRTRTSAPAGKTVTRKTAARSKVNGTA